MAANPMVIPIPRSRKLTNAERIIDITGAVKEARRRIGEVSDHAANHWIAIGLDLIDAKKAADECGHGPFEKWFPKSDKDNGDEKLFPFSYSTGKKLIAIARFFGQVRIANQDRLPASWMTLYTLTQLPPERITSLIESGDIHPMMTRANASALRGPKPKKVKKEKPKPDQEADLEMAYAVYRRIPKKRLLTEVVALLHDCGVTFQDIQEAFHGK